MYIGIHVFLLNIGNVILDLIFQNVSTFYQQFQTFLTMSLKAFSIAPITRLSCETFFSVKKRVGGVLGEPGAPAAPLSDAALVRARWVVGVR